MAYIGRGLDNGVRNQFVYAATQGQTAFTGADSDGKTLAMTDILYTDCYQNGVKLKPTTDYTVSSTTLTLVSGASLNDVINIVSFDIFAVADTVAASTGGTFVGQVTFTADTTFADGADIITASAGTSNFRAGVNAGNSIAGGGNFNTVVGDESGTAITTGDANTFFGYASGDALDTASNNTAIGHNALTADTKGSNSVAIGKGTLANQNFTSATDSYNVAVGASAGNDITTGTENTLIGGLAGDALTTGSHNTYAGYHSGSVATTAANNTGFGAYTLDANTSGTSNVAVGKSALGANTTGSYNTALGLNAADANTTASAITAVGFGALGSNTTGASNTAVGADSLDANTTGANNTALGNAALGANTTGASNTVVGASAGAAITTGIRNVCIGQKACNDTVLLTTGGGNVVIGYEARTAAAGTSNTIVMGNNVTGQADDNFTFGTGATDSNIAFGATSITAPSDVRLKEDIQDEKVGLGFINDLRPVTFQWKKEKDIPEEMKAHVAGSEKRTMNGKHNHGFIAQEVKAVIDNHNMKDGFDMWTEDGADGRQRIGDASLMPIMVKALQELSAKNDALEARLTTLEG